MADHLQKCLYDAKQVAQQLQAEAARQWHQIINHRLPPELQELLKRPEAPLAMVLLLVVVLVLVLLAARRASRKKRSNTIVIAGPCNSGKTTLFFQLRDGSLHQGVVASMEENAATVTVAPARSKGRRAYTARLVDIPGHHHMRTRLEQQLSEARGVVFVLDSVDISPHKHEAAELLYEVLAHPDVQRRRLPVLVACNKTDLQAQAHSMDFIKRTLERQIDAMRKTKTAAIGKTGQQESALGKADRPFSFEGLRSRVCFKTASAQEGEIEEIDDFIASTLQ